METAIESSKDSESKYKYLVFSTFDKILNEVKIENVSEDIQNI